MKSSLWNNRNSQQRVVALVVGLLALILLPLPMDAYAQQILILIMFSAFAATAWNIICGFVGVLSLGHALYLGLGAYVSSLLLVNLNLSPWIGMLLGAVVATVVAVLVSYPCFRLQGPYFTLATIALASIVMIWVQNNEYLFGIDIKGSMGILLPQSGYQAVAFDFEHKITYYYVILAFLLIGLLVTYLITRSRLGYYLVAIKSDPDAAESLGISLARYKLTAMAISTFLIAIAGTFFAQYYRYVGPDRVFGTDLSVEIALIALIGGQGTILGPVFGSVLLTPISQWLAEYFGGTMPGLNLFVYGIVMMAVVFFMPNGIHAYVVRFFKWIGDGIWRLFGKEKPVSDDEIVEEVRQNVSDH